MIVIVTLLLGVVPEAAVAVTVVVPAPFAGMNTDGGAVTDNPGVDGLTVSESIRRRYPGLTQ